MIPVLRKLSNGARQDSILALPKIPFRGQDSDQGDTPTTAQREERSLFHAVCPL